MTDQLLDCLWGVRHIITFVRLGPDHTGQFFEVIPDLWVIVKSQGNPVSTPMMEQTGPDGRSVFFRFHPGEGFMDTKIKVFYKAEIQAPR
jgi:hypothetical protein